MLGENQRTEFEVMLWRSIFESSFNSDNSAEVAEKNASRALEAFRKEFPSDKK